MKKIIISIFCLTSLNSFAVGPKRFRRVAQEQNTSVQTIENKSVPNPNAHTFYLGLESTSWDYTEEVNGKRFMEDEGVLYGVFLEAKKSLVENYLGARGKISYLTGSTNYDGSLQHNDGTPNTPYQAKTRNDILETRAELNGNLNFASYYSLVPSVGVNYRSLVNPEDSKDSHDYTRHAEYLTAPVGLAIHGNTERVSYGVGAEYHNLIKAQTTSYLGSEIGKLKNVQEKGQGREANVFIAFKNTESNAIKIGVYYRDWNFEDSKAVASGNNSYIEPQNKTEMIGANISFGF
jgi:hypothetical protein